MKKKTTLLKSLLLAAAVMTGTSAWAGTTTLYSQDYESTTKSDWTSPSYANGLSVANADNNSYHKWTNDGQNNRNAYFWFGSALDYSKYEEYTFSTKICVGALPKNDGKQNLSEWVFAGANSAITNNASHDAASNYYLVLSQKEYGKATYNVQVGATTLADPITLEVGTWYTVTQTISKNSVTTIITDGTKEILNNTNPVGYETIGHLKGINLLSGRYYGAQYVDDILVTTEVDQEIITAPTINVTYAGENRTVTITEGTSSDNNTVTTYYTTDGTDPTATSTKYIAPIEVKADCTIKAVSISSTSVSSEIVSIDVTVGNLKLNAPAIAKTAYSGGKYTISISNNQSDLAYVPASVTTYYRIGDTGEFSTGESVSVTEGEKLYAYIAADNYTSSEIIECETAVRPFFSATWKQDYTQATSSAGTGAQGVVLSTTEGGDFKVGETPFYNILGYKSGENTVNVDLNTNVGLSTATNFSLRCNGNNSGILQNGSNQYIGIQKLNVGDYIVITTNGNNLAAGEGVTLRTDMSTTSEYIFEATATEASILFYKGTYNYVKTISVNSTITSVTAAITSEGSRVATFCSNYALDFTNVEGLKAYIVTGTDKVATLQQVTKVPAGTGVILEGDVRTYDIPVIAAADDIKGNLLKAAITETTAVEGDYVLAYKSEVRGFFPAEVDLKIPAGKAYLHIDTKKEEAPAFLPYAAETTGIGATLVNSEVVNNEVYNLAGQRVAKPTKGLYIVGGRKVVVK